MNTPIRNEAGEIVRGQTKRMNVSIYRPQYRGSDGQPRWVSRFYYARMVNGVLARFPLCSDPAKAEKLADQIAAFMELQTNKLEDAKRIFNPRAIERGTDLSTVGELIDFHRDHLKVLEVSNTTATDYYQRLLLIIRRVDAYRKDEEFDSWKGRKKGMAELLKPWLEKSLAVLTERAAMDYQRLMVPPDMEDEEEEITQKITCDTNLRCARSIFSREAMKLYKASSRLALPDLTGFMSVSLFNAKKFFVLPEVAIIRNLFTQAPQLKADDLNAYRAFLVCVQAGLRKSEASALRLAWLIEGDDPAILIHTDGSFKPKHGHGRKVLLDSWAAEEIRALTPVGGKYFLAGSDSERNEAVFGRLNAWLRTCGVDSKKPTHELRKLWFSQKTKREGVFVAAKQGGHRDVKITQSFYADSQMPDNVLPFWQEPTLAALAKTGLKIA